MCFLKVESVTKPGFRMKKYEHLPENIPGQNGHILAPLTLGKRWLNTLPGGPEKLFYRGSVHFSLAE